MTKIEKNERYKNNIVCLYSRCQGGKNPKSHSKLDVVEAFDYKHH